MYNTGTCTAFSLSLVQHDLLVRHISEPKITQDTVSYTKYGKRVGAEGIKYWYLAKGIEQTHTPL